MGKNNINFVEKYNSSILFRMMIDIILNILLLPLFILLLPIKYIFRIQFIKYRDNRIGHLAMNTDLFLREFQLGIVKKRYFYIALASARPSNEQLISMFKRKITTITVPAFKPLTLLVTYAGVFSILSKAKLFYELPFDFKSYYAVKDGKPVLSFTEKEEEKGRELLRSMGIDPDKDWYVCFHSRDSAYLRKASGGANFDYHSFRDCSVKNYMKAAEYITKQGGFAIRMGDVVAEKLPKNSNKRIFDYATKYRTDFGDIYLPAKCKFFLGNTAGLFLIASLFNTPVAHANLIPLNVPPYRKKDLFIPMKIWSESDKRYLTYKEIRDRGVLSYQESFKYKDARLREEENLPEDILALAQEMNSCVDGHLRSAKEDELLQKRFKEIFKDDPMCKGFSSKMGIDFLKKNRELLK